MKIVRMALLVKPAIVLAAVLNMAPSSCEPAPTDGEAGAAGETDGHAGTTGDTHGHGGTTGDTHGHGGTTGDTHHGGTGGTTHGDWPPWSNYYEEYPAEYRHLLYDPAKHPGGGHHDHGTEGTNHHALPENDCHLNPPTHEQIRAANDFAVKTAIAVNSYPTFPDEASFNVPGLQLLGVGGLDITGGYHYLIWENNLDPNSYDPTRPEYVIYSPSNQGFRPVGAMFGTDAAAGTGPGPDFGGCLTAWHTHEGDFGLEGHMLHVWTFGPDKGPFSEPPQECWGSVRPCLDGQVEW